MPLKTQLNITEEEYRALPNISYSDLARYEREGFSGFLSFREKEDTASLLFGSAVDTYLTEGVKAFDDKYYTMGSVSVTGKMAGIIEKLAKTSSSDTLSDVTATEWVDAFKEFEFYPNLKFETKRSKFFDNDNSCEYEMLYKTLQKNKNKTFVAEDVYDNIIETANALKYDKFTGFLFNKSNRYEILYQTKLAGTFGGVPYKCMVDILVIDHENKCVIPFDLKTSSHLECEFYESFIHWRYDIQARLYWKLIRANLNASGMSDYELKDYKFVIISSKKDRNIPLIWNFENTQYPTSLYYNGQELRHPFNIGYELFQLIQSRAILPGSISREKPNNIEDFLKITTTM